MVFTLPAARPQFELDLTVWPPTMAFRPESNRSSLARVSLGGANNRGSLAGRPSLAAAKRPSMAPVDDRRSRGPSMGGR